MRILAAIALFSMSCSTHDTPMLSAGSDDPCGPFTDEATCETQGSALSCGWLDGQPHGICVTGPIDDGLWPGSGGATCTCASGELCVTQAGEPLGCESSSDGACGAIDPGFCTTAAVNNLCYCTTI